MTIGAQPMLIHIYTVPYTYLICVMQHWFIKGLCGLVVSMLGCRFRNPGFESRLVKKNNFASVMLTEIIN